MALTERKRKFAEALMRGERKTDAARQAGYSAATASQMANKLGKDADVLRYMESKRGVESSGKPDVLALALTYDDPIAFLKAVMNDSGEDIKLRVDAAKAMLPYMHQKKGEGGKKDARQEAAQKVAGRFAPSAPPKLVASGGKAI